MKTHDIAAIMVVHLGGYPCDMERINALGVPVIEDCAHAFGARYSDGKRVGSGKNLCCFSFHAVKNLPIGDGGMIVTSGKRQQDWFKKQRWLGIDKDTVSRSNEGYAWEYEVEAVGYKYHMNDIAAIIGLAQLERVRRENIFRRRVAAYYAANMPQWVRRPDYNGHRLSAHHFYPMFFSDRKAVYAKLLAAEIFPGMHYKMNTKYAPYQGYPRMELDSALEYEATELTLPLHLGLTQTDMKRIVEVVSS
jgi:perosamine synthetase